MWARSRLGGDPRAEGEGAQVIRNILGMGRKPDDEPAFWWENPPRWAVRWVLWRVNPSHKLADIPRLLRWIAHW